MSVRMYTYKVYKHKKKNVKMVPMVYDIECYENELKMGFQWGLVDDWDAVDGLNWVFFNITNISIKIY